MINVKVADATSEKQLHYPRFCLLIVAKSGDSLELRKTVNTDQISEFIIVLKKS